MKDRADMPNESAMATLPFGSLGSGTFQTAASETHIVYVSLGDRFAEESEVILLRRNIEALRAVPIRSVIAADSIRDVWLIGGLDQT